MLTLAVVITLFAVIHSPPTAHARFDGSFFETALRDVTNAAASVYVPAEGIIADVSRFFEQTANHITNTAASFRDFIERIFAPVPPLPLSPSQPTPTPVSLALPPMSWALPQQALNEQDYLLQDLTYERAAYL